jgi:hypothetical protein
MVGFQMVVKVLKVLFHFLIIDLASSWVLEGLAVIIKHILVVFDLL